jgi:hypothetical protein
MLFLIELDHVKQGTPLTPEIGRAFIEQTIFPTLARAEELVKAKKILAGGPVLGRVALRLIVEADSLSDCRQNHHEPANLAPCRNTGHAAHRVLRTPAACRGTVGEFAEKVVTAGNGYSDCTAAT